MTFIQYVYVCGLDIQTSPISVAWTHRHHLYVCLGHTDITEDGKFSL